MHAISRSSLPPGPSTPSLLQALRFARDPFGYLATCAANYGDLFTLRLPGQPATIVPSAPELVRQCFALRPTSPRRPLPLSANVGEQSLIFLDGEPHQRDRQLMLPHLHGERLRGHADTMQAVAAAAVSTWLPGQVVPIHAMLQRIALDIIPGRFPQARIALWAEVVKNARIKVDQAMPAECAADALGRATRSGSRRHRTAPPRPPAARDSRQTCRAASRTRPARTNRSAVRCRW